MEKRTRPCVAIVEPCWHGLGYIEAARARGYEILPIVASKEDPKKFGYEGEYDDLIVADITDPDAIVRAVKNSKYFGKIDAICPGDNPVVYITAKVAEMLGLMYDPPPAFYNARYKDAARIAFEAHGVSNPKFAKVKTLEEAKAAIKRIGLPVVFKPTDSGSSQDVYFINSEKELAHFMGLALKREDSYEDLKIKSKKEYLIEEFVRGPEFSIEIFLKDGEVVFASVTEKLTTPLPYFVEIAHVVPTSICESDVDAIVNESVSAVLALGFKNGPFHAEAKLSSRGPVIIEVNGRCGGDKITTDLLINAFGVNFFEANIDHLLGNQLKIERRKHLASSIAFLVSEYDGKLKSIEGVEDLSSRPNVVKCNVGIKAGDVVNKARSSDDHYGYVITVASTPLEAKQSALNAIRSIKLNF